MEVSEWLSVEVEGVGQMGYTPHVLGSPFVGVQRTLSAVAAHRMVVEMAMHRMCRPAKRG